ncbi:MULTISPECIES: hypothetical protein [Leeuwenhoekiella]|jgi:hypothetical protein|uniref:Uncharacterized protein n=1 Tax=Leeuwenhoekiella blandensis (strain CECT 7118 / CCUG 51940 / KCTC 22103 / MED217) TaxID=398720 RepID=A3XRB9_LEEBM|nr:MULTISPECIES: hypothetical protein [Leeuwenhoekiella]EAQ47900.1 hypothetical protein MED217_18681 [Leeuwenhoekiella blandensis MED217]MAO44087.1 hypothetical protein [Leeuwenhoekiella sp.]MBQ51571.1 hypothetical protein [Leeuwenhoekiella sp.]HCW63560.1 hypothetical protein [Leeuwenhoekiella sp.]|tara:strand:+ start:2883 stop:3758 length:876 start_codon:yes stop_codon:yes gene_type:complete
MKKKLKSDLVSLAHKILKLDSESDYETLKNEAQKIYEALSVLAYIEASFDAGQPATDKAEIIKALEDENTEVIAESIQEIQQEQVEETPTEAPQKEETELERIARIAAANEELFERLRTPEEPKPKAENPKPKEQKEPKINQASLHEPVMEKIKDIVAQMPPEADAIEAMFQQITQQPDAVKNDKDEIGEYGRIAEFEEDEKPQESKPKRLNDRISRGLSFGLNDRIAFIKHLFNGSDTDYNRVLSQLNTANSEEEAFNLIDQMVKPDYNNWEGKEMYETRFKELIARKFD